MTYRFLTTCTGLSSADVPDLHAMIEDAEDLTYAEFLAEVPDLVEFSEEYLGYDPDFRLEEDWHVSYHKSTFKDRPCVYLRWSAIEHIWVLGED